jgi:arginyl-tRNA synthetase
MWVSTASMSPRPLSKDSFYRIERKSGFTETGNVILGRLCEREALQLLIELSKCQEVFRKAVVTQDPCYLVNYLSSLCGTISSAIRALRVKGKDPILARTRLQLFRSARLVLREGLALLGLPSIEYM